jgi:hypothetical protein
VSEDKANTLRTMSADQAIGQCNSLIGRLRLAAAEGYSEEAEHVCKMLSDHMSSVRLPCDYLRETLAAARHLHMQAAMKATEIALDRASALGRAKQTLEHAREMSRARNCLGKAALLGAPRDFRQGCESRIAAIVLAGGRPPVMRQALGGQRASA